MTEIFTGIFSWSAAHKVRLIRSFYVGSLIYAMLVVLGSYLIISGNGRINWAVWLGGNSGKAAVLFFLLTTLPGMLGRFNFRHPLINLGMMFRRETGIASFFLGLGHSLLYYFVPKLAAGLPILHFLIFEAFGLAALLLMTFLYLTSNDWMRKVMGKWWKRLHALVYVIYWLIFLHLVLREVDLLSLMIGAAACTEVGSLIYAWRQKRRGRSIL